MRDLDPSPIHTKKNYPRSNLPAPVILHPALSVPGLGPPDAEERQLLALIRVVWTVLQVFTEGIGYSVVS